MSRRISPSFLSRTSIRMRLLILIGTLLALVIGAAIWFGYREVIAAANDVGRERLRNLTDQFVTISQQSATAGLARTSGAANDPAIRTFLQSPTPTTTSAAMKSLQQFAPSQEPNSIQVELWRADRSLALMVPENSSPLAADLTGEFQQSTREPFRIAGALRVLHNEVVGDYVAAVRDEHGAPIGYLVRWRKISLNPNPGQLKQLLGNDATLYFGNANDNVWTDLTKIVPNPPPLLNGEMAEYKRDGHSLMALKRAIPGTPWAVAIEISNQAFANQSRLFLRRTAIIGLAIFLVGLAAAFIVSQSITRPLQSLTEAATEITSGNYSGRVAITRSDELGELAEAFNAMVAKVGSSQRELERKVRERTAQLEAAAGAILMVDERGFIQTVNKKAEELFGYDSGELVGQSIETLVPKRFREAHPGHRTNFFGAPSARPMGAGRDLYAQRKDGSEVPVEIALNPIQTESGSFAMASIVDITERKRADERFRVVVEASPSGILMIDGGGEITLVNAQTEELFGYKRAELLGRPLEILLPERYRGSHPDLRTSFFGHPSIRAMGAGRDLYGRRKDGSEVAVEIGLRPIETSEGLLVLATIIDITERKRREAQLHMLSTALESAANAIVITDAYGKIIWVNRAFTENTGYFPEEVLGKNPRVLKSGLQDDAFYKEMWQTITAGRVWRKPIINRRKDGSLINEDMTITPIRDTAGLITQFVAIKQDITELEQALSDVRAKSDELAAMTQQLWQASRLATVGELAASIAHELNNPLATISLRLETLGVQLAADETKSHLVEIVSDEVDRMGKLVGNLLQFSRRTHRQISTLYVRDEIDSSLELIEYHLRSHGIQVVREYPAELYAIQADRQQLRQVFLNLLTNASDAMTQGGEIDVRVTPDGDDRIRIEVTDTGAGIPPDSLENIWDPFFTTKPEGKGTGLGLAICRRVIEEHHGSISIASRLGEGTTVTILLPTTNGGHLVETNPEAEP